MASKTNFDNKRIADDFAKFRFFDVATDTWKHEIPDSLPQRPARLNNWGRECALSLNTYNVVNTPDKIVHQYDVSVSLPLYFSARIDCCLGYLG
jgi:hypothetical protein